MREISREPRGRTGSLGVPIGNLEAVDVAIGAEIIEEIDCIFDVFVFDPVFLQSDNNCNTLSIGSLHTYVCELLYFIIPFGNLFYFNPFSFRFYLPTSQSAGKKIVVYP